MHIRDLMPWSRDRLPAEGNGDSPLVALQRDMNRAFDAFWQRFDKPFGFAFANGEPKLDVSETDEAIEISVELPGMDESDVEVSYTDTLLTIRGEKKQEAERKEGARHIVERSYGTVYRSIPLPPGLDAEKAVARFDKGVLSVTLPKTPEAKERVRRIAVTRA